MNTLLIIGTIVILFLLIGFLLKVVRAAMTAAIAIVLILIALRFFGIEPQEIFQEIRNAWENMRLLKRY